MGANDIETAILSVSTPGVEPAELEEARRPARELNEYCAHIILSHAGGFLPIAATRMAPSASPTDSAEDGLRLLRTFYFDTALSGPEYALPSLLAFADPTHITTAATTRTRRPNEPPGSPNNSTATKTSTTMP